MNNLALSTFCPAPRSIGYSPPPKRPTKHLLLEEIDPSGYAETTRELRDRLPELKLEIDARDHSRHKIINIAVKAFELSQSLCQRWFAADFDAKLRILEINFSSGRTTTQVSSPQ